MTIDEVLAKSNQAKCSKRYQEAIEGYRWILENGDIKKKKSVLPMLASCLNSLKQYEAVHTLAKDSVKNYGKEIRIPELLEECAFAAKYSQNKNKEEFCLNLAEKLSIEAKYKARWINRIKK